jgi:hypothetical protein
MKRIILGLVASLATAGVLAQTAPQAGLTPVDPQTQEAPATAATPNSSQPTTMPKPVPKRQKPDGVIVWGGIGAIAAVFLAVNGGGGGSDHASSP